MFFYLAAFVQARVFLEEHFDLGWENRWKRPTNVRKDLLLGKVRLSAGNFFADERLQRGLETLDARRNYLLYANLSEIVDSNDKDLIIQYTVRMDFFVDCSGAYIKLFEATEDPNSFDDRTPYAVMFGPDVCGAYLHKTHVIVGHKGQNYPFKRSISCYKDHLTHAYTLILRKNNTVEVLIDGEIIESGPFTKFFNVPLVTEIPDPNDKRPQDWDFRQTILDKNDVKPDDWDDREFIEDPDSFRPPFWDDSMEWMPPMIRNPDYKGVWTPREIPNPAYKGVWTPRKIKSEETPDPEFGHFRALSFIGIDVFQNTPGTIFNHILVTDDEEHARKVLKETFLDIRTAEIKSYDILTNRVRKEKEIDKTREEKNYKHHKALDAMSSDDERSEPVDEAMKLANKKRKLMEKKARGEFDDL